MKKCIPLLLLFLILFSVSAGSVPATAQTAATGPESVIMGIVDALNNGDVEGALAFVADQAVVVLMPPPSTGSTYVGKAEIGAWWETFVGNNGTITVSDMQSTGTMATWSAMITEDAFTALGLESLAFDGVGIVHSGLLQSYTWIMTEEDLTELMAALPPVTAADAEPETMTAPDFGPQVLNGTYGFMFNGTFFLPNPDLPDVTEPLLFNMGGTFVADGQGNIVDGQRTLSFGGNVEHDTLTGTYTINANGSGSLSLNAFQDGVNVAIEEFDCVFTSKGETIECLVTRIARIDSDPPIEAPVVGHATGVRLSPETVTSSKVDTDGQIMANERLATRYMEELWNDQNLDLLEELIHKDFVSYAFPEGGREVLKEAIIGFHADNPGGTFAVDEMTVTEDHIMIRGGAVLTLEGAERPHRVDTWLLSMHVRDGKIADRRIAFMPVGEDAATVTDASEIEGVWRVLGVDFDFYHEFNPDGSFHAAFSPDALDDEPQAMGEYWIDDGQFFMRELEVVDIPPCGDEPVIYEAQLLASGKLQLSLVEDGCPPRVNATNRLHALVE